MKKILASLLVVCILAMPVFASFEDFKDEHPIKRWLIPISITALVVGNQYRNEPIGKTLRISGVVGFIFFLF